MQCRKLRRGAEGLGYVNPIFQDPTAAIEGFYWQIIFAAVLIDYLVVLSARSVGPARIPEIFIDRHMNVLVN